MMDELSRKKYGPVTCTLQEFMDGTYMIESYCTISRWYEQTPALRLGDSEAAIRYAERYFPIRALTVIREHPPWDGWGPWAAEMPAIIRDLETEIAWNEHEESRVSAAEEA